MADSRKSLDELLSKLNNDIRQLLEVVERHPDFAKIPKDRQATIVKLTTEKRSYALVHVGVTIDVPLTPREEDVVRLVGRGEGNDGIAVRLKLSPNTVKNHLKSVYAKTRIRTRAALARYAAVMIDPVGPGK